MIYKDNKFTFILTFCLFVVFILIILNINIVKYEKVNFSQINTKVNGSQEDSLNINNDFDIRLVQSPIIFALPTKIGFSKDLLENEKEVDLFSVKSSEKEFFFKFDKDVFRSLKQPLSFNDIKQYQFSYEPIKTYKKLDKSENNLHYQLSKNLESILIDDSILIKNLASLEGDSWFVKASLYISENGFVDHVFIDDISEKTINKMSLLNALYNIKFKSGVEEIGWIILNSIPKKVIMEIFLPKLVFFIVIIPLSIMVIYFFIYEFKLKKSFRIKKESIRFCMECKKPFLVNQKRENKNCPRCKKYGLYFSIINLIYLNEIPGISCMIVSTFFVVSEQFSI